MGRRRKPNQQKRNEGVRGEARMRNEADYELLSEVPEPPDWLNVDGAAEFRRLAQILVAAEILTAADVSMLEEVAALKAQVIWMRRNSQNVSASVLKQLDVFYREFGLTPASRSMVVPQDGEGPKKKKPGNAFAELSAS